MDKLNNSKIDNDKKNISVTKKISKGRISDKDLNKLSEKEKKRLLRNRANARRNYRRRQEYIHDLEKQNQMYQSDIEQIKKQNQIYQADIEMRKKQNSVLLLLLDNKSIPEYESLPPLTITQEELLYILPDYVH